MNYIDESAPCGCRRIKPSDDADFMQVVACPEHHDGCPGPWSPSVIVPREYPDDYPYPWLALAFKDEYTEGGRS